MCVPVKDASRRQRVLFSIGCLCLALALGSRSLNINFGLTPDPLDFLRGLLLGIGTAASLHTAWTSRRRNNSSTPSA